MLDLATLKATLQPIRKIGEVEERFTIQDVEVCMRVLSPREELEIQRWAQAPILAAPENTRDADNSLAVEYLNRFKLACLAHSLVEVQGLDLRDEEYVATGEVLSNGKPVKVKKTEAILELLQNWPRPLVASVFRKFNEIMERCEIQSDKSIDFDPPNIDTEINRLLQRIQTLEEMKKGKENQEMLEGSPLEMVNNAADEEAQKDYDRSRIKVGGPKDEPARPETSTQASVPTVQATNPTDGVRRSAIPQAAAPLEQQAQDQEYVETPQAVATPQTETIHTASGTVGTLASNEGWVDTNDADAMQDAVAAETQRIQRLRENMVKQSEEAVSTSTDTVASNNPRFTPPNKR